MGDACAGPVWQASTVAPCTLSKLGVGCCGQVVNVSGDSRLRRRLLEMGFCTGAKVEVIRRAPLGDAIEFRLRGYHLSLRADQAEHVLITPDVQPAGAQFPGAAPV